LTDAGTQARAAPVRAVRAHQPHSKVARLQEAARPEAEITPRQLVVRARHTPRRRHSGPLLLVLPAPPYGAAARGHHPPLLESKPRWKPSLAPIKRPFPPRTLARRRVPALLRRRPPLPPLGELHLLLQPRSTDPSDTPSMIPRGSSRHPLARLAPPLTGRQAPAAATRVRRQGPSPVLPPPRPSGGIKPWGPAGRSPPVPGRTRPPDRRNSAGASPSGAQGPNCKGKLLSKGRST
jgi:hypothetical protein